MKARVSESGFTLIESIFTIVIIAIAMTALVAVWSNAVVHSADPFWQAKSASLGRIYQQQIAAQRYDELACAPRELKCSASLGPERESRGEFDDVDDYHNLLEQASDALGQPIADYDNYQISVQISYAGDDFDQTSQRLKKISIEITTPQGEIQQFVSYRGNY